MAKATAVGPSPLQASEGGSGTTTSTGSGNVVFSTSPTLVTPTLGAATASSLTFSPTTNGMIGTTAANNASSGIVGEVISSTVLVANAISLSTGVTADITSISLTAGDWTIFSNVYVATSSTITSVISWSSTTSASQPDTSIVNYYYPGGGTIFCMANPPLRITVSTNTTVYLSCTASGAGTLTGAGQIYARRRR
jgi:hypothetical protein